MLSFLLSVISVSVTRLPGRVAEPDKQNIGRRRRGGGGVGRCGEGIWEEMGTHPSLIPLFFSKCILLDGVL